MSFLTKHGGPLCFGCTAAICLCVVLLHIDAPEPESFATLEADTGRLRDVLAFKDVSPSYRYGDRARAKLVHSRAEIDTPTDVPPRIVYPRPGKPTIDPASIPNGPLPVEDFAVLPAISQLRTLAERGRIRIEFQIPETRYLQNLRVDLFRGTGTDTMDTVHPFGSIDLEAVQAKDGWFSFSDTHVEPKCRYFYRLQLVSALNHSVRLKKDEAGKLISELHILPPKLAELVTVTNVDQSIFAAPLSAIISDVSPTNFEIRFSGTTGKVPLAGAGDALALDYSGRFLVRIWINEIQEWKEQLVDLHPGERLAGRVLYKPTAKSDFKAYPFDTGKVLEEIRRDQVSRLASVQAPKLSPDNTPELDPQTHQPVTVAQTVKTSAIPTDVAVLKDMETGRSEELTKR
jgi:hypothetical protein